MVLILQSDTWGSIALSQHHDVLAPVLVLLLLLLLLPQCYSPFCQHYNFASLYLSCIKGVYFHFCWDFSRDRRFLKMFGVRDVFQDGQGLFILRHILSAYVFGNFRSRLAWEILSPEETL